MKLELNNDLKLNNNIGEKQTKFLQTNLGKVVNAAVNIGIRAAVPNVVENEVIKIKDSLLKSGLADGIEKAITKGISMGKNAIGIAGENFKSIGQVKNTVNNVSFLERVSNSVESSVNIAKENNLINKDVSALINNEEKLIMDNISNNINLILDNQEKLIGNINKYSNNWNNFYEAKDFNNMEKEFTKLEKEFRKIMPIEDVIRKYRAIENIHNLIKNKGVDFNLSKEEVELSKKLAI